LDVQKEYASRLELDCSGCDLQVTFHALVRCGPPTGFLWRLAAADAITKHGPRLPAHCLWLLADRAAESIEPAAHCNDVGDVLGGHFRAPQLGEQQVGERAMQSRSSSQPGEPEIGVAMDWRVQGQNPQVRQEERSSNTVNEQKQAESKIKTR
jgi:hypothetical protein